MPNLISVKIDVTKLDKARFFRAKPDASGHCPIYADLVLLPLRKIGKFGDTHLAKQSKKKDEVIEMPILGGATERGPSQDQPGPAPAPAQTPPPSSDDTDDMPF